VRDVATLFRTLADEARLRMLRLLAAERLNVSELTAILGLAQSGVSRHLSLLRQAGLVEESREGGYAYYRFAAADGLAGEAWSWLRHALARVDDEVTRRDTARLAEVLRLRKERFRTDQGDGRRLVPGRSWAAWARLLGHLLPPLTVADLGCGEGYLTIEAAAWARRVIGLDRSPDVLQDARGLAARRGSSNIVWCGGDLEALPLATASVDVVLLSQALHHARSPAHALAEAARILRPGGTLLLMDLRRHDQAWVREELGDCWLGFEDDELVRLLEGAGLEHVRVGVGARLHGDPFTVLVASGRRPHARSRRVPGTRTKRQKTSSGGRRRPGPPARATGAVLDERLDGAAARPGPSASGAAAASGRQAGRVPLAGRRSLVARRAAGGDPGERGAGAAGVAPDGGSLVPPAAS
jgi:ArsR family transcriptional regulator